MSFIEGIGDEVTLFFVIVVVFVLAALVTLIGNGPSFTNLRTRHHLRRPSERESQTLRQIYVTLFLLNQVGIRNPEIFTTAIQSRGLSESESNAAPQSFDDFINEGTADNDRNADNDHNSDNEDNPTEEQSTDQVNGSAENIRTAEGATANSDMRTEDTAINGDARTFGGTITEEAQQLNSGAPSAPPLEEAGAVGTDETPQVGIGEIRVRLKYLDDTEKTVTTSPNTKIADFKKKHFREDINNNKVVRLIFAGHLLHNNTTVQHCRIIDNSVVHVQVLPAPAAQAAPAASQEAEVDVSRLLWPVITVILGMCWVTYFKYPEFYNSLSLGMLLLFSGCFFYFLSQAHH